MENQIEKINPIEYGLQESEVTVIEQAFMPKIVERDGYAVVYEQLITKELTKELCSEARELRLKLVKTRTGIADIHKSQKAYFLAAGKFVDAWKNKETTPIEQMEENLKSIETHYERIEAERIAKLESERKDQVLKFTEFPAANLALMSDDVFKAYLRGVELAYDDWQKHLKEEEAAAAPDREKIIAAVNSVKFELPQCKSDQMQAVANTINQKFESFKKWAIEQTNNI